MSLTYFIKSILLYKMDLLYSAFFGFTTKLYDETIDLKLTSNSLFIESLKSLNIMLFTLLSYNDFSFSLYILVIALFTHGADESHWKTFIIISLILCTVSFKLPDNIPLLMIIFTVLIFILNAEHKAIPEEASLKKLLSRVGFLLIFCGIYFSPLIPFAESYFGDIRYITKIVGLFIGTLFLSIIVQIYLLYEGLKATEGT
jgi:hypothetical protein